MANVSVLEVLLYGEPIGTLTRVEGDRSLFAFNEDYIADENRPVLGLGFKDKFGELLTEFRPYQNQVMPFFSNLLPEERLRDYLAERAGVNPEREFFLLWVLGRDLPVADPQDPGACPAARGPDRHYGAWATDISARAGSGLMGWGLGPGWHSFAGRVLANQGSA